MRPRLYAPPRRTAPFAVYSNNPAIGVQSNTLRVGLFVNNNIAAGLDSYIAGMGSQVGMQQADFSLVGQHDVAASARCLFEGIAGRGTYLAPASLQNNDIMTEYRTDARDSNGAQTFGVGRIWFQVEGAPAPGIVPTGIYFGVQRADGVYIAPWRIGSDGRIMPLAQNTYDIGGDTTAEVRQICLSVGVRVGALAVLGTRKTGYTNAMTGTKNRATAYATGTITLIQLAERVGAIEDDLIAHGIIGA